MSSVARDVPLALVYALTYPDPHQTSMGYFTCQMNQKKQYVVHDSVGYSTHTYGCAQVMGQALVVYEAALGADHLYTARCHATLGQFNDVFAAHTIAMTTVSISLCPISCCLLQLR